MEFDEFVKYLLNNNNEARLRTETEQYKYSRIFMKNRLKNNMSVDNMAKYLNIDKEVYVQIESGDVDLSVEYYRKILDGLLLIQKKENWKWKLSDYIK